MVLREDAAKATYTQKVDFAKLRSELLSADSSESNTTRSAHERLANDIAKLQSRLKDEINRTQASVRLDLNLEKGRIREEAVSQELKIKETETKIEQEVAALRQQLEQVKFQSCYRHLEDGRRFLFARFLERTLLIDFFAGAIKLPYTKTNKSPGKQQHTQRNHPVEAELEFAKFE